MKTKRKWHAYQSLPLLWHRTALAPCGQTSASRGQDHQHNCKLWLKCYKTFHFVFSVVVALFSKYSPGVLGAMSCSNSFMYCGAGVNGSCAAGVPSTIRNGDEP